MEPVQKRLISAMNTVHASSLGRMATRPATFAAGMSLLVLGLAPLMAAVVFSFTALDGDHLGLEGYRVVLDPARVVEVSQVFFRAAIATSIAVTLGVPTAFQVRQLKNQSVQLLLLALMLAPWLVSDMLRAFGWQLALSPAGLVNGAWTLLSGRAPIEGLRYNHAAALVGLVSATLPTSVMSTFAALPRTDSSEWRAARELGSPGHIFRLMTLGRARLGVAFGTCMTFLLCLFASAEPQFLDGPTRSSMLTIASSLKYRRPCADGLRRADAGARARRCTAGPRHLGDSSERAELRAGSSV